MYTINGNFFEKMKRDLLIDYNKNNILYQSYIKTIYEGVEKKALKTLDSFENLQLYSAQYFTEKQIKEINDYRQNTVDYYQVPIVYSKLFFSFTKDIRVAEYFLQNYQKNTLLTIVGANKEYNLNSHDQIEDLSSFKEEQEVLFFHFSAFGIEDFIYDPKQKIYNIKLLYLGRFLKEYEIKDKFNIKTDKLPENYFIKLFKKSRLIDEGVISKMKVKEVKSEQNSKKVCNCMILKHFISLIIAISALVIIGIVLLIYFLTKKEEECNAGQYYSSNLSKCLNCSIGYFSSKGAKSCSRCPEGETSSIGSSSCSKCEAGTFRMRLFLSVNLVKMVLIRRKGHHFVSCANLDFIRKEELPNAKNAQKELSLLIMEHLIAIIVMLENIRMKIKMIVYHASQDLIRMKGIQIVQNALKENIKLFLVQLDV